MKEEVRSRGDYATAHINQQNTSVPSASSVRAKWNVTDAQAAALLDFFLKRGITKMGVTD
jgi:hypothetical protein